VGWQGSGGSSVATTTINIWFGGVLLWFAAIGEFLLGNTFPMMVFFAYGAHFLSFATTSIPWYNAIGYFNPDGSGIGSPGVENQTAVWTASYGKLVLPSWDRTPWVWLYVAFYPMVMCILSFIFLIGSLRTNLVFVLIFIFATIGFGLGAGAFFHLAHGNTVVGLRLAKGLGACFFATGVLGFYFLLALVVAIMELPIPDIPVFDMSTVIKARSRGVIKEE
jgi:succinate-acetate transporter protein